MYITAMSTHLVLKLYKNKNIRYSFKAVVPKLWYAYH